MSFSPAALSSTSKAAADGGSARFLLGAGGSASESLLSVSICCLQSRRASTKDGIKTPLVRFRWAPTVASVQYLPRHGSSTGVVCTHSDCGISALQSCKDNLASFALSLSAFPLALA